VDVVLGVSMGSTAIRMVLVEGENADGATVDEDNFHTDAPDPDNPATSGATDQVLSAILGTREGAAEGGYALTSTGVVWSDPTEAAVLRDALAAYQVENVMLVSAFVAGAALAQAVGHAAGCSRTAMLLVEPDSATLGIVDSDDGSITVVCTELLDFSRDAGEPAAGLEADTVAQLAEMVTSCDGLPARPEGVFVVGDGIDIAPLKPALEAVTGLRVSAPEEPETALARGAALASANAPLFASTVAALAYSQDPGTDKVDRYLSVPDVSDVGSEPIAYSCVPDPETDTDTDTALMDAAVNGGIDKTLRRGSPLLLVSTTLAATIVIALVALEVALAINIRTTVALQPSPQQNLIVPTKPAPAPTLQAAVPIAQLARQPAASVPNRVVNAPAAAAAPAAPAPPAAPVPAPAAAPAPVPAAAPAPVPVPVDPLPILFPLSVPGAPPQVLPVPAVPPQVLLVPAVPPQVPNVQLPLNQPGSQPVVIPPPVRLPNPPVQLPTPPVQLPTPPVQLPTPPVQLPTPNVQLPKRPVQLPAAPKPPAQLPTPQVRPPKPLVQLPAAPTPPVQLPTLQLPLPKAPTAPILPAPGAPAVPAAPGNPLKLPHIGP
jgi:hypothetical protein